MYLPCNIRVWEGPNVELHARARLLHDGRVHARGAGLRPHGSTLLMYILDIFGLAWRKLPPSCEGTSAALQNITHSRCWAALKWEPHMLQCE